MKTPTLPNVNWCQLYGMLCEAVDAKGFRIVHNVEKGFMDLEERPLAVGETLKVSISEPTEGAFRVAVSRQTASAESNATADAIIAAARQPVASNQPSGNPGGLGVDGKTVGQEPVDYIEFLDRQNESLRRAIHAIMAKLVFLLDEDQFADVDAIALAAGASPPAQPVGQIVGYMDPEADFLLPRADGCVLMGKVEVCLWRTPQGKWTKPLYDAPPEQPVDLGQFRRAVRWAHAHAITDEFEEYTAKLLALIDSGKAVSND